MDRIDKIILLPPLFGFLDCLSTLHAQFCGFPLEKYEAGFLASFFAKAGLFVYYIPISISVFALISCMLFYLRKLQIVKKFPTSYQKVVFLLILLEAFFIPTWQIHTILSNILFTKMISINLENILALATTLTLPIVMFVFTKKEIRKSYQENFQT